MVREQNVTGLGDAGIGLPLRIVRACGHHEVIFVQRPVDYVRAVAEGEPCRRCGKKPAPARRPRSWWPRCRD